MNPTRRRARRRARSRIWRQYYDTGLNNHEVAVEATLKVAPFDHVVLGTDWPYLALPDGNDATPGLGYLGSERRALLEGEHARALVPRLFETD